MTLPQGLVDQGYRLLLGRLPNRENPPQYDSTDKLCSTLLYSAEFKAGPRAQKRDLGWPHRQMFVSHRARVVYNPIGKNACTFLKQQMARMSDIVQMNFLLGNIHLLTDLANTGLQLCDYSEEEAEVFLTSPDWLRIVLLRDPRERLLSAYIEKFVIGRNAKPNISHTRSIIDPVQRAQGIETPDYDRGITFRDFITEIASDPPQRLDPHWIQQSAYLADVTWDRIYAFEDIGDLVDLLDQRSGMELPRLRKNTTDSGKGEFVAGAADMLPAQLLAAPRASIDSFYDDEISAAVAVSFAEDNRLLAEARAARAAQDLPAA